MKHLFSFLLACSLLFLFTSSRGQTAGELYYLSRPGSTIPAHPAAGDHSVSERFPDGSIARILTIDSVTGWLEIAVDDQTGWIIRKYLGEQIFADTSRTLSCVVGTWNLEWFKDGKGRGFPESASGGESYGPRTMDDYIAIAELIREELHAAVLALTEIHTSSSGGMQSAEMDRLVGCLGGGYKYYPGEYANTQDVVLLYDTTRVRLNTSFEIVIDEKKIQGKDIFDRDPLVAHFTALSPSGNPLNDFIFVGLHLASGQDNNTNHSKAMMLLTDTLAYLIEEGDVLPAGEDDIILTGDLNLDYFDKKRESHLEAMEAGEWDILADKDTYPATRLAKVSASDAPFELGPKSKIDYIIVTDAMRGDDREVQVSQADVHQELANDDWPGFREHFSDHFPVTVALHLLPDDD